MRVSRPQRTQGRDSIQRNRLSVVFPQRSQCWGPRIARRSRQPAQVRSKLKVPFSGTGWVRSCRRSGDRSSGRLDSRSAGSTGFADSEAPWPLDGGTVPSSRSGHSSGSILPRQGCHFWPSRQGLTGRERPSAAVCNSTVRFSAAVTPPYESSRSWSGQWSGPTRDKVSGRPRRQSAA